MKKEKIKEIFKIFIFIVLLIIGLQFINNVEAAINTEYGDQTESTDVDLDKKIKASTLLDYIGAFIYAIGNIAESVTSGIMSLAGAGNIFPWADKVIFNTIPILDVNFINPDTNSLLATSGNMGIGEVVRNVYFSGLSIALGFFGVIISILAIKLAISTIGSEKAKYKEALTKWITSLVLLFGMHFALAFIFFLNENLVVVASQMLEEQVTSNGKIIQEKMNALNNQNSDKVVDNFLEKAWDSVCKGWNMSWSDIKSTVKTIQENQDKINDGGWDAVGAFFGNAWEGLKVSFGNMNVNDVLLYYNLMIEFENYCDQNKDLAYGLISNDTIQSEMLSLIQGNPNKASWGTRAWSWIKSDSIFNGFKNDKAQQIKAFKEVIESCVSGDIHQQVQEALNGSKTLAEITNGETEINKVLITITYNYEKFGTASSAKYSAISILGEYFKKAAWYTDIENGGWAPDQVSIVAAILYTMFVFQSISFFISYVKRFFYVVILAVLAPFVVLYDFLGKSISL